MTETSGDSLSPQTIFGFTGEPTDSNKLVQLRARYYHPALGVLPSLDPFEGDMSRLMTLNRFIYAADDPTNKVDPSGLLFWNAPGFAERTSRGRGFFAGMNNAHPTIEYWLERENGFWQTLLEWPGMGIMQADVVIFDYVVRPRLPLVPSLLDSPLNFKGYVGVSLYEIEPLLNRDGTVAIDRIIGGIAQLGVYGLFAWAGIPPMSRSGYLPLEDAWPNGSTRIATPGPTTVATEMAQYGGRPYNWTWANWRYGLRLTPSIVNGPVPIRPVDLFDDVDNRDEIYWTYLISPGLILYVSQDHLVRTLRIVAGVITAAWIERQIRAVWEALRRAGNSLPPALNNPVPAFSMGIEKEPAYVFHPSWYYTVRFFELLAQQEVDKIRVLGTVFAESPWPSVGLAVGIGGLGAAAWVGGVGPFKLRLSANPFEKNGF